MSNHLRNTAPARNVYSPNADLDPDPDLDPGVPALNTVVLSAPIHIATKMPKQSLSP